MPDRQFKQLSPRSKDRTVQGNALRPRIAGGRHYNDAYLRSGALETLRAQREITVKASFVKFVKDDRIDAFESWVGSKTRVRMPSVTNRSRVRARPSPSKRTW